MPESIFIRIKRVVSASIEDCVDRMERAGGAAIMRESIREVESVVDDAKTERDSATARRLQAVRQQGLYRERLGSLQEKAEFAMAQSREDLAEAALLRQVEFEQQIEALVKVEAEAAAEEKRLEEALASLVLRKAQMEEELNAFEAARQEAGLGIAPNGASSRQQDARVARAESAFNRAMSGSGISTSVVASQAKTAASLGEIDQMMKSSLIAERMAALRDKKKAS